MTIFAVSKCQVPGSPCWYGRRTEAVTWQCPPMNPDAVIALPTSGPGRALEVSHGKGQRVRLRY